MDENRKMGKYNGFFKCLILLPLLSNWLENGFYVYRENNFVKIPDPGAIRFPLVVISSSKKKKKASCRDCSIKFGDWSKTTLFLFNDKVVSFYKHRFK